MKSDASQDKTKTRTGCRTAMSKLCEQSVVISGHARGVYYRGFDSQSRAWEGVKYRMLHIPGILDCTYHLHVSVSVCSRF